MALDAGVVGDLVVGEEGRVDDRAPGEDVADHRRHLEVALHHRPPGAGEDVAAAAVHPRPHVVANLVAGGAALAADVSDREGEGPRHRVGPGEVGGVVPADRPPPSQRGAHRQHRVRRVAGEDVGAAGAVGVQETAPVGVAPLDLFGVAGMVGDDRRAALLLPPAEGGHVLVGAVQEARLAGPGLRGPVGFPAAQTVDAAAHPGGESRRAAVLQRPQQDVVGEAVDLEEEHAGDLALGHLPAEPGLAANDVAVPGVVLVDRQQRVDRRGESGDHDRDHRPLPHAGDFGPGQEVEREGDEDPVEEERRETQRQHRQRQGEAGEQRPDEGVEDADHRGSSEGRGSAVEDEAIDHLREQQEDAGVEDEDEDPPPDRRQVHTKPSSTVIRPLSAASRSWAKSSSLRSA